MTTLGENLSIRENQTRSPTTTKGTSPDTVVWGLRPTVGETGVRQFRESSTRPPRSKTGSDGDV